MNNSNNVYNATSHTGESTQSAAELIQNRDTTTIDIGTDIVSSTQQQQTTHSSNNSTTITMDDADGRGNVTATGGRSVQRNLLSFLNEARSQLGRQASYPGPGTSRQAHLSERSSFGETGGAAHDYEHSQSGEALIASRPHVPSGFTHSWRVNLNEVFTGEAIRSLITHTGGFRYTPLSTSENEPQNASDNTHMVLQPEQRWRSERLRALGSSSWRDESGASVHAQQLGSNSAISTAASIGPADTTNRQSIGGAATATRPIAGNAARNAPTLPPDIEDDNNVVSEMLVKVLSYFMRYLPFLCILLVKFLHDHLLGILDLFVLHSVMYQANKSLRKQVSKLSQKSYMILLRDFGVVAFVVAYRFLLSATTPDVFGLLITPSWEEIELPTSVVANQGATIKEQPFKAAEVLNQMTAKSPLSAEPTAFASDPVVIKNSISLGTLIYYVAVNDLILKLITILVKIIITMLPTRVVRHKPRARIFVLFEYFSQFYRAMAPVRQWLMFLFESYVGLEMISGVLFSSFYIGAKAFELTERGKYLKKSLINFIRNMDYERKPTKDELEAAGAICPICHDSYSTPVVLECGHIFCDDCVSTWFKREQTCPMCRAKVSEDPTWQDGSTTFFYQLY